MKYLRLDLYCEWGFFSDSKPWLVGVAGWKPTKVNLV